jgi:hypothetical protein
LRIKKKSNFSDPVAMPVRLAYQPPASGTFLSEQTSHQQPANSTFLSEQTSTSHKSPAKRTWDKWLDKCTVDMQGREK